MKRRKPDREITEEERKVVVAVRHCAGELNDILQGARRKVQSNSRLFAETGISVMFRAVDCYADLYEKLQLKSREALERLFHKFSACEDVQDSQDAIEETEGNWRNFLTNLDREVSHSVKDSEAESSDCETKKILYLYSKKYQLIDTQNNRTVTLEDYVNKHTCLFVSCQPAYWPDCGVRWRHAEISKVKADLSQFNVGYLVITWGPSDAVRSWAKQVSRATKWPVLWDKSKNFVEFLGLKTGLVHVWSTQSLDFLGNQKLTQKQTILPPPIEIDWTVWQAAGAELVLAKPVLWDSEVQKQGTAIPVQKKGGDLSTKPKQPLDGNTPSGDSSDVKEGDISECIRDRSAVRLGEIKVCLSHPGNHLADFAPSGSIYQSALTCYARAKRTTEANVMDNIRQNRRFCTPPESARLQFEPSTGLYYDPETALYYDAERGYFYDAVSQNYYYWSAADHRYQLANALIQAEIVTGQVAQFAAAQAANMRAAAERNAARRAAQQVAAQLAEIRASKDDYAAYVYATCVLPQQEQTDLVDTATTYQTTAAAASNIEASMKATAQPTVPLVPYVDEPSPSVTTPPPPGL